MPRFSATSRNRLATCDESLQRVFERVVSRWDCTVVEGHRDQEAQDRAFREGKSKLRWPNGKHNRLPSRAVDVAPYPIDWGNTKRFYAFGGYVLGVAEEMGIALRFGGDWDSDRDLDDQSFNDLIHFELKD